MTAQAFRDCLAVLFWSQRQLSEIIRCDERVIRRFAQGQEEVPEDVAAFLRGRSIAAHAYPAPDLRRQRQRRRP